MINGSLWQGSFSFTVFAGYGQYGITITESFVAKVMGIFTNWYNCVFVA